MAIKTKLKHSSKKKHSTKKHKNLQHIRKTQKGGAEKAARKAAKKAARAYKINLRIAKTRNFLGFATMANKGILRAKKTGQAMPSVYSNAVAKLIPAGEDNKKFPLIQHISAADNVKTRSKIIETFGGKNGVRLLVNSSKVKKTTQTNVNSKILSELASHSETEPPALAPPLRTAPAPPARAPPAPPAPTPPAPPAKPALPPAPPALPAKPALPPALPARALPARAPPAPPALQPALPPAQSASSSRQISTEALLERKGQLRSTRAQAPASQLETYLGKRGMSVVGNSNVTKKILQRRSSLNNNNNEYAQQSEKEWNESET